MTVGCVASLVPHKGHAFLIEAAKILKSKLSQDLKLRYLLVGDGVLKGLLNQLTKENGVADLFEFVGAISDIGPFLATMDISVLPSIHREGLGISLIESMAAGIPVIASRLGGIPEVIEHGKSGLLVEPGNASALASAIQSLTENRELRLALVTEGRKKVKAKFSEKLMVKKVESIYRELMRPGK
jgi:glycosyltransferase involved in cell wall biosynthesis